MAESADLEEADLAEKADLADVSEDALLGGTVTLLQPRRGHRAGTDAVLLARTAPVRPGDRIVDLGAATGAVGLMAAMRAAGSRIVFVEQDADLVALCRENIRRNGLTDRAVALVADVFAARETRRASGLMSGSADLVVTNPPFLDPATSRLSPDPGRRAAHAITGGSLSDWLAVAADLLVPRGRLALIHRADQLASCLDAVRPLAGAIAVTPVHPHAGSPATRVLVSAVKGSRAALSLRPPLILHEADGSFTAAAAALHGA
jgi:tRNA1(Val) A37 N6-methylase TrmN6